MTIRSLINFGSARQRCAGVDVHINSGRLLDISFVVVEIKNDVLFVIKQLSGIRSVQDLAFELKLVLPTNARVHLNLRGKEILSKITEKRKGSDFQQSAQALFPMIKASDFLIQYYKGDKNDFVSVIRQDAMEFFKDLAKIYTVADVSLGSYVIGAIFSVLKTNKVVTPDAIISVVDGKIVAIDERSESMELSSMRVGHDEIPGNLMLACASAWNLVLKDQNLQNSSILWIKKSVSEFHFQERIYQYSRIALITVFVTLLINSLIYFWLKDKTTEMSLQNSFRSQQLTVSREHEKKLSGLLSAQRSIGWESNDMPLYYADQLAKTVPSEIQLTELEIGVLDRDILRKEKREYFRPSLIHIIGQTNSLVALQGWIKEIENLAWVKELSDQKYSNDSKQVDGMFEFYVSVK